MSTNTAIESLVNQIQTASADASPEQLAYLGKAMESLGGKATVFDVIQAGEDKKAEIMALSTKEKQALADELETALIAIGERADSGLSELDKSKWCIGFPETDSGQSGHSLHHMLFKMKDGTLLGVGRNVYGALGQGDLDVYFNRSTVINLPLEAKDDEVDKVYIAGFSSTILMKSGDVYACGYETYGSMGQGNDERQPTLVKVPLPAKCIKIAVGSKYSPRNITNLYLLEDGRCFSSGYNAYGQCGVGDTINRLTPALVNGSGNWVDVGTSGSAYTSCWAVDDLGKAFVWGYNGYGNLGLGDSTNRNVPTELEMVSNVKKLTMSNLTSYSCTCLLTNDGDVWTAGYNAQGQCGAGNTTQVNSLTKLETLSDAVDIILASGDYGHSFALLADGTLKGWGYNGYGNLGIAQGNTTNQLVPSTPEQFLEDGETIEKIVVANSAYNPMSFVLTSNKRVLACGNNSNGHLGFGNTTSNIHTFKEVPVKLNKNTRIKDIFINGDGYLGTSYHAIYLLTESGEVLSCGYGHYGQLGRGRMWQHNARTFSKVIL